MTSDIIVNEREQQTIEQLWFTWSNIGIDTINAGYRIRAASPGLREIYSERIKNLKQHVNYSFPGGRTDFAITSEEAPICLAFIRIGQEYILVHKQYVDKNTNGPDGIYFTQLLANLPSEISAREAITLWRSSFWQSTDERLADRRSTMLEKISLVQLKEASMPAPNLDGVQLYLPFVILAYLIKKPSVQIYIAAATDDVAELISGLTRCLPLPLIKKLTFSTYEADFQFATTEIVGTCQLFTKKHERAEDNTSLFSPEFERSKLVLNTYKHDNYASLSNPLLVDNQALAHSFAQEATEFLLKGTKKLLFRLLQACAECSPTLSVEAFLTLYETIMKGTLETIIVEVERSYLQLLEHSDDSARKLRIYGMRINLKNAFTQYIAEQARKQSYDDLLEKLLLKMADDKQQWQTVIELFGGLVKNHAIKEKVFLFIALHQSLLGNDPAYATRLEEAAQLSSYEKRKLKNYQSDIYEKEEAKKMKDKEIALLSEKVKTLSEKMDRVLNEQQSAKKDLQELKTLLLSLNTRFTSFPFSYPQQLSPVQPQNIHLEPQQNLLPDEPEETSQTKPNWFLRLFGWQ